MKRTTVFLVAVITLPALAENPPTPVPTPDAAELAEYQALNLDDNRFAPTPPWHRGWQMGLAVPLAPAPLGSVSGFIGHANKNASGFWKKRIGYRVDFAFSTPLSIKGYIEDDKPHLQRSMLGFTRNITLGDRIDPIRISDDLDGAVANIDGINGMLYWESRHLGGLIDFYPFGNTWFAGGWRISGGYYTGKTGISLTANLPNNFPNDDGFAVEIIGDIYARARIKAGTKIGGRINWNYHGPYAGLGFDLGLYRGIKLFTDFGVVFANAPRLRDNNLYIPERNFQACIADGTDCTGGGWIDIDILDPNATRDGLLAQVILGLQAACRNEHCYFGGVDYSYVVDQIPTDVTDVFNQVVGWLNDDDPRPSWVDSLINVDQSGSLAEIILDVEKAALGQLSYFDLSRLTDEYLRIRRDAVNDVNDALKDFRFVPMIRLGVMYRF